MPAIIEPRKVRTQFIAVLSNSLHRRAANWNKALLVALARNEHNSQFLFPIAHTK
jgi:hypothetical protein